MNFPFDYPIILENSKVLRRPIEQTDFQYLLPLALEDKKLLQFSPAPIYSETLLETYISTAIQLRETKNRYTFIVFDKLKLAYAGSTSFLNISNNDERLEIGATWYGKSFQRTGLNRQCKFLLLEYAFEILKAHRVEFKTDERNIASRTAIEKIGATYEGNLREHTLMYDGFRRNTVYYSILKNEWEKSKDEFLTYPKT